MDTGVPADGARGGLYELLLPLAQHWGRLLVVPLVAGAIAVAGSYLVPQTFTASALLLPPQPQQTLTTGAIASFASLAGLSAGGPRSPADQYVSLMLSSNATDRIIDRFKLMEVYGADQRWKARRDLLEATAITVGKKDGLLNISVEDESPQRAADIANAYVDELKRLTGELAITEAQSRRAFFEQQLKQTQQRLIAAQTALQASGFSQGALKAEPRAAAEGYARLRAELATAEVRLQAIRGNFADGAPEVRQLQDTVAALRGQLARSEAAREPADAGQDYVSKYREFKYQETLFELLARQFELARVDEAREGALVQVVDVAKAPERKTRPKRSQYGITTTLAVFLVYAVWISVRWRVREARENDPAAYARWQRFVGALGLGSGRRTA
jgi:capsule polysaccharide export protein KpsE/RkpR